MKKLCFVILFTIGIFSVSAQDIIVLKNGSMIDAKVMEISPTEIRYKRSNHLDGPTIVVPANDVLSIRYANGMTEVIGGSVTGGSTQTPAPAPTPVQQPTPVQTPVPGNFTVQSVTGTVWRQAAGGGQWRGVNVGDTIDSNSFINTTSNGSVTLTSGNDTYTIPSGKRDRLIVLIGGESTPVAAIGNTPQQLTGQPMPVQQGTPTALQSILNSFPAISILGNNLKFEFNGETWTARVNGENFSAGTIVFEATSDGGTLTLKQTHIWPGAVGKTAARAAGRLASLIPGGDAIAGVINTAGDIAGTAGSLVGAVESTGTEYILEYKSGPPASLRFLTTRNTGDKSAQPVNDADAWKHKWFYIGGAFGFGGYSYNNRYEEPYDEYRYDYYGDPYTTTSYKSYEQKYSHFLFVPLLTTEIALLPFFSIEADIALITIDGNVNSIVLPLLGKIGGRFAKVELSFDIGFTFFTGFTLGGTFGFKAGPGVLYTRFLTIPTPYISMDTNSYTNNNSYNDKKSLMLGFIGYKVGLGNKRRKTAAASSSAGERPSYSVDLSTLPMIRNEKPLDRQWADFLIRFPEFPVDVTPYTRITIKAKYFDGNDNEISQSDNQIMVSLIYNLSGDIRGPADGPGPNTPLKEFNIGGPSGTVHRDKGAKIKLKDEPEAILFQNANPYVKYIEVTEITFHD